MSAEGKAAIREVIVVEGKYDVLKVRAVFESPVISTDGFGIYRRSDLLRHLDALSRACGILLLTDGDAAGRQIRNFIRSRVTGRVLVAYIPDLYGKEKRKSAPSAEGKLGVEGMSRDVILDAVRRAGASFLDGSSFSPPEETVTRTMLYDDGLFGGRDSRRLRTEFCRLASLPDRMNVSSLLEAVNLFLGRAGYESLRDQAVKNLKNAETSV